MRRLYFRRKTCVWKRLIDAVSVHDEISFISHSHDKYRLEAIHIRTRRMHNIHIVLGPKLAMPTTKLIYDKELGLTNEANLSSKAKQLEKRHIWREKSATNHSKTMHELHVCLRTSKTQKMTMGKTQKQPKTRLSIYLYDFVFGVRWLRFMYTA